MSVPTDSPVDDGQGSAGVSVGDASDTGDVSENRYSHHVFICGNVRPNGDERGCCTESGSMEALRELKSLAREAGLKNVRIQKSGCLSNCGNGITCVVYPEGVWYTLSGKSEELQKIITQHLQGNVAVKELLMED